MQRDISALMHRIDLYLDHHSECRPLTFPKAFPPDLLPLETVMRPAFLPFRVRLIGTMPLKFQTSINGDFLSNQIQIQLRMVFERGENETAGPLRYR